MPPPSLILTEQLQWRAWNLEGPVCSLHKQSSEGSNSGSKAGEVGNRFSDMHASKAREETDEEVNQR